MEVYFILIMQKVYRYSFNDIGISCKHKMPKSLHFIERRRSAGESITDVESSSLTSGTASQLISNGICSFNPTSTKGKWIFLIQTTILTFFPISILLAQNGYSFYEMMIEKEQILHKSNLVRSFYRLSS